MVSGSGIPGFELMNSLPFRMNISPTPGFAFSVASNVGFVEQSVTTYSQ